MIDKNEKKINALKDKTVEKDHLTAYLELKAIKAKEAETKAYPKYFPFYISLCYAFFVAVGGIIWFYYLSLFLVKIHNRISDKILNRIIHGLGIALCGVGIFFGYTAVKMFL